jgi:hypothetical protein
MPDSPPYEYALCARDYFKRRDLICHKCDDALRGSYVKGLGRKYHLEHFTCHICDVPFGDKTYYEHEDEPYCFYHYATLYASLCEGCTLPILKEFVRNFPLLKGDARSSTNHFFCSRSRSFATARTSNGIQIVIRYTSIGTSHCAIA